MKPLLTLLLILTLCFTAAVPAMADEVSENPIPLTSADIAIEAGKTYTISSKDELINFRILVNSGCTFEGAAVELISDISLNEGILSAGDFSQGFEPLLNRAPLAGSGAFSWIPIGSATTPFSGTFEGNNHTISGMLRDTHASGGCIGFFETCCSAVIRNLRLENFYLRGYGCGAVTSTATGACLIENCHVSGVIATRGSSGGIIGTAYRTHPAGEKEIHQIINCSSDCIIFPGTLDGGGKVLPNRTAGGIAGTCRNTIISECTNHGNVYGKISIGSILGSAEENTEVINCRNFGTAVGEDFQGRLIGNLPETETETEKEPETFPHAHAFETSYYFDENRHFLSCSCGQTTSAAHQFIKEVVKMPSPDEIGTLKKTCPLCSAVFHEPLKELPNYTLEVINGKCEGYIGQIDYYTLSIAAKEGAYIKDVFLNGVSLGPVTRVPFEDGDVIKVIFAAIIQPADTPQSSPEDTAQPDKETASTQNTRLIKGIQATTIKASSVNVHNGSIRITWKKSPGYKVDYYQVFRSTKKNSGYGKKAFYTTKTGKATTYTNSKNLKVGTRYYYKVRGVRVIDGKKYYTQYSNKANRRAQAPIVRASQPY